MEATAEQKRALVLAVQALADAIRELGSIPSGHLYARLMDKLSLETYQILIGVLKQAGKVKEENFLLTWIGGDNDTCN